MSQTMPLPRSVLRDAALPTRAPLPETGALRARAEPLVLRFIGTIHCLVYRASGGRLGRTVHGGPVLLLTTIGRRSGRPRTWPLCYVSDGDALVLIASAGGAAQHPGWYLNLLADPCVTVHVGDQRRTMRAQTAEGTERARLWERVVRHYPICADYQRRTTRLIPVVVLERVDPSLDSPVRGGSRLQNAASIQAVPSE